MREEKLPRNVYLFVGFTAKKLPVEDLMSFVKESHKYRYNI
jgi:hypothetical protein